jgi:hypothetical protein
MEFNHGRRVKAERHNKGERVDEVSWLAGNRERAAYVGTVTAEQCAMRAAATAPYTRCQALKLEDGAILIYRIAKAL